jgi:hypothetical protein
MRKALHWVLFAVSTVILFNGCAGKVSHMKAVPKSEVSLEASKDDAVIVFMRPSPFGFVVQSSIYEIIDDKPEIVGILAAEKRMAYRIKPGKHLFMVVGESADFMEADVVAGRTYYATVVPRIGFWKLRYSFNPLQKHEYDADPSEIDEWLNECDWVIKTTETEAWFKENAADIEAKYRKYYKVWIEKEEKPALKADDGL